MTLGERIKACRQHAGMSQEKVAELVGISRQAVTKWESDQSAPNTENLFKLAEIFGTTVDLLLNSEEESNETTVVECDTTPVTAAATEPVVPETAPVLDKKYVWIPLTVVGAILVFLVWQAGQNIGEDIGTFLYNIFH